MTSEKLALRGYVQAALLREIVGGLQTITEHYRDMLRRFADRHNWFLMTAPKVIVRLPAEDSAQYYQQYVEITVWARALPVTSIEREVFGGHLC